MDDWSTGSLVEDNEILLDYKNYPGSGAPDLVLLVQDSLFTDAYVICTLSLATRPLSVSLAQMKMGAASRNGVYL